MKRKYSLAGKKLFAVVMSLTIGFAAGSSEQVFATDVSSEVVPIGTESNYDSRTVIIEEKEAVTGSAVSEPDVSEPDGTDPIVTGPAITPEEENGESEMKPSVSGPGITPEEEETMDRIPPEIVFSEHKPSDSDGSDQNSTDIEVMIVDSGEMVSGIGQVFYSINDGEQILVALSEMNLSEEKEGEKILSQSGVFHILFQETGEYRVTVWAEDEAGNQTEQDYTLSIEENPIISVMIPTNVKMVVDPFELNEKGQIYSEEFAIVNLSNVDIDLNVKSIECSVNTSNAEGIEKECTLSLNKVSKTRKENETLAQVSSQEGTGKKLQGVQLKAAEGEKKRSFGEPNVLTLTLTGTVNPESLDYWREGDVKAHIEFTFEKSQNRQQESGNE